MIITLNNTSEEFAFDQLTVSEIMKIKNFTFKLLIVKLNDVVVPKDEYDTCIVKEGDNLMILHLISGG